MTFVQKLGWSLNIIGFLWAYLPRLFALRAAMNPEKLEPDIGSEKDTNA